MAQRNDTAIKRGAIADVMSRLSELPTREKAPGAEVSLPEVFREKKYLDESRGALKKGYTFDDIAEIFTGVCGVNISARQMKYHYTREKNKREKIIGIGKKSKAVDAPKDAVSPENSARTGLRDKAEGSIGDAGTAANVPAVHTAKPSAFAAPNNEACSAEAGAFLYEKRA